jgi:hypothetical protein
MISNGNNIRRSDVIVCQECEENIQEVKEDKVIHSEVELCGEVKDNEKIKKTFWEVLPKKGVFVDWINSIGHMVKCNYEGFEFEVEIVEYQSKGQNLWIKYLDKEPFKINTSHFKYCELGKLLGKYTGEFKVEIGTIFKDNKRNLIIIDREYRERTHVRSKNIIKEKWYKYKCNICGFCDDRSWMVESSLITSKQGCSCCDGRTVVEGINSIVDNKETHWMIPYFPKGYEQAKLYTKCSAKRIYPICPDCGRIKETDKPIKNIYNDHSIGCSCSDGKSYNEKFMFSVLEQLNIISETEKIFEWCKYNFKNKIRQGKYDFYFEHNNKEYIIETDGGWHKKDNSRSGQTKEESKEIDDYKDRLAKEHNIEPIRIDCEKSDLEYIKDKIIHSRLNELFDLSVVNWKKAVEFALSNLVKIACDYKNNNPNITTTGIGELMDLCRATIGKYLKNGNELEWCNYNPKEESHKNASKNGKMNGKPVEIFKEGISLGVFESASELERQSESLFGIKLLKENTSAVCLGKYKQCNGFIFKYIKNKNVAS